MPRIVALNVQHGGGTRQLVLAQWLIESQGDVLVLPEWRSSSTVLDAELRSAGYTGSCSLRADRHANGVAVFSKLPHRASRVTPAEALKGELLKTEMDHHTLVAAYFPQAKAKADFFERCGSLVEQETRPLLILGDLNTGSNHSDIEPGASRFDCEREFLALSGSHHLTDLWRAQHGEEAREWTWRSRRNGFRLDHAFANPSWLARFANWRCVYDHSPRERNITDHSALVVDC